MKKLGFEKIEKESSKNYLTDTLKMKEPWLSTYTESANVCIPQIPKYVPIYQDMYKLTKDQCDTQYSFFIDCMGLTAFAVNIFLLSPLIKF